MSLNAYTNLVEATNDLLIRGYSASFKYEDEKMICINNSKEYASKDMKIVEYHRFEGMTNPEDMSIIFAIECNDGIKGVIINSFGTYADLSLRKFMDTVNIKLKNKKSETSSKLSNHFEN